MSWLTQDREGIVGDLFENTDNMRNTDGDLNIARSHELEINEENRVVEDSQILPVVLPVERQPSLKDLLCSICFENPINYSLVSCNHSFCTDCLHTYFATKITSANVIHLLCPNANCAKPVAEEDVEKHVSATQFEKYKEFVARAKLFSNPDCRSCPKPDCSNIVLIDRSSKQFPKITCTKCEVKFCFHCNEMWHPKTSCEKNRKKLLRKGKLSQKDLEWKKRHTKNCPSCRAEIEKDIGCNHMICVRCDHQFCWLCLQTYQEGHYERGPCANLCFTFDEEEEYYRQDHHVGGSKRWRRVRRVGKNSLYVGAIGLGGVIVVGLAVPALILGAPLYVGYQLGRRIK